MKTRIFVLIVQVAVLVGCLAYLLTGIEWSSLLATVSEYSPLRVMGIIAITIPFYWLQGLRLAQLSNQKLSISLGIKGSLLAIGINNILPAKLGEFAKAGYFRQKSELTFAHAMGIIFIERFLDINILALTTLGAAILFGLGLYGMPLMALVIAIWIALFLLARKMPADGPSFAFLPISVLRDFARRLAVAVHQAVQGKMLVRPVITTFFSWVVNFTYLGLIPLWLMQLDLSSAQVLGIFAAVYAGLSIPGMPGGLGMTEGAIVAVLAWSGVPKTEALAVALTIRFFNFLPPTLLGMTVFATSGLDLRSLRSKQSQSL